MAVVTMKLVTVTAVCGIARFFFMEQWLRRPFLTPETQVRIFENQLQFLVTFQLTK